MAENRQPAEAVDGQPVDIVIVTVREDENKAVLSRLPNSIVRSYAHRMYHIGSIQDHTGTDLTVAVVRTLEQGESAAQDTTRDAIEDLNPALIMLVGIAGGVPDREFTLGDVVFATRLHDFSVRARLEGQPEEFAEKGGPMKKEVQNLAAIVPSWAELTGWETADSIGVPRPDVKLSNSNFYGEPDWRKKTKSTLQFHFKKTGHRIVPIVTSRPIASSGDLIKDTQVVKAWLTFARDLIAMEMELGGVYQAASRRGRQYPVIAIRSLSDIVGFKRDDDWTNYACHAAASFCFSLLKHIPPEFTVAGRAASAPSPTNLRETFGDKDITIPAATKNGDRKYRDLKSLLDVINVLDDRFGFRWERSSFDPAPNAPLVYWPVRLRPPTPIHAVQCFTAAALQRRGAEVKLFLDDLGTPDHSVKNLQQKLTKWFQAVGGSRQKLTITQFSKVLQAEPQPSHRTADPWASIRRWLGDTQYLLENVLRISKLVPLSDPTFSIQDLERKRPRRLLTPALVWSCLVFLRTRFPGRSIITLGGYDENPLWQAWRVCSDDTSARVGHLYVPLLREVDSQHGTRAVHMGNTNVAIEWTSRVDIKNAVESEFLRDKKVDQWYEEGRLIPWCIAGCVLLPRFLKGLDVELKIGETGVNQFTSLAALNTTQLSKALVDELARWLM